MANFKALFISILIIGVINSCKEDKELALSPVELVFPKTEASNQPLDVTLEWQHQGSENQPANTPIYEVYLGKSLSTLKLVASELTEPKFECEALELNTEYFWKVQVKASGQAQDSQIRNFTTANELPSFAFGASRIMIYPATYQYAYPDSLVFLVTLKYAGAFSWQDGLTNTKALLKYYEGYPKEELGVAAKYCDDLQAYGFTDWYLPSIVELDSVVSKFDLLKSANDVYWSSTEYQGSPHLVYTKSSLTYPKEPYSVDEKGGRLSHNYKCKCVRRE